MNPSLTEIQLDALRELANIASGTAATALSQMLAREVEINVPRALALPPADAVDECGDPEQHVAGVVVPIQGDIDGIVLLLIPYEQAENLCGLLGVEAHTEVGDSALREIGNILATSYLNGLGAMTGMELSPRRRCCTLTCWPRSCPRCSSAPPAPTTSRSCSTPSCTCPGTRARSPSFCSQPPARSWICWRRSVLLSRRPDHGLGSYG